VCCNSYSHSCSMQKGLQQLGVHVCPLRPTAGPAQSELAERGSAKAWQPHGQWGVTRDKADDGFSAHQPHTYSPQPYLAAAHHAHGNGNNRRGYMPPILGSTTPALGTKKKTTFFSLKDERGATSDYQGPMSGQTAFFLSATFSVFLL
jgi:hypothetical protein